VIYFQQYPFWLHFPQGFFVTGQILVIANHKHPTPAIGIKYSNRIAGHICYAHQYAKIIGTF
jgi:hypothetical protein